MGKQNRSEQRGRSLNCTNVQVCTYLLYWEGKRRKRDDVGKGKERKKQTEERKVGSDSSCWEEGQERTRG